MNQAILITAYKNFDYLKYLVSMLYKDFDIYIHVDRKSKEIGKRQIKELKNCKVIREYKVAWGGATHLYAVLKLLEIAVENKYDYYHIISAEDIPTKSFKYFKSFFKNNKKIYVSMNRIDDNLYKRYKYWYIFKNSDSRKKLIAKLNKLSFKVQRLMHVKREKIGEFDTIYKGYLYCSLPNYAVEYCILYNKKHPEFLKELSYCLIPEEFYFQTVLGNSKFRDNIANDCLRYSLWEYKHGTIPGYLDINDFDKIKNGNYLFARKVSYKFSSELIKSLSKLLK